MTGEDQTPDPCGPETAVRRVPANPARAAHESVRRARRQVGFSSATRVQSLIRAELRSGELRPDDQLVEDDLMRRYSASRSAVRDALQVLAAEGMVTRRPRHGTNVRYGMGAVALQEMFPLASGRRTDRVTVMPGTQQVISAPPALAHRLETADTRLLRYEQLITLWDMPATARTCYIPLEHLPDPLPSNVVGVSAEPDGWDRDFEELFGLPLAEIVSTVEATTADASTAADLGVLEGAPILAWEALLRGADGRPRILAYTYYRAEMIALTMTERKLPGQPS